MLVISKSTFGEHKQHYMYGSTAWEDNPYPDDCAIVPPDMEEAIKETQGYCDIKLSKDGTEVTAFAAREIPKIEEPEQPVTEYEQLRADIDYLAIMTGVTLCAYTN